MIILREILFVKVLRVKILYTVQIAEAYNNEKI